MSTSLAPDPTTLAELRADLAVAARLVPATWPLPSLVAANPLRAFEHLPFTEGCHQAERWFGARTHRSLSWYRQVAADEGITPAALEYAVLAADPDLALVPPCTDNGMVLDPVEVIVGDLLHGPARPEAPQTDHDGWLDQVVDHVGAWCAAYVDPHPPAWLLPDRDRGFFPAWKAGAVHDRVLRRLVGRDGCAWISALPDDPLAALQDALDALGVPAADRIDALRAALVRLPGWCGLARWVEEWAPSGGLKVALHVVDLAATLAVIDAAAGRRHLTLPPPPAAAERDDASQLAERVAAAVARHRATSAETGRWIASVLARPTLPDRAHLWLVAHERTARDRVFHAISRLDPGPLLQRPAAQVVVCIDVRSEVLRRHLENTGDYETFGFAGFFGIPLAWRPFDAPGLEARCPVLVAPRHEIPELPAEPGPARTARQRRRGLLGARHAAKGHLGAPFALAESTGWFLGLAAAAKTFRPEGFRRGPGRRSSAPGEAMALGIQAEALDPVGVAGGITLEQRVLYGEAIIRTIGMQRFAPLVVLCGHTSRTVNNPHAASLACGACGGAPGGVNARVAAAILNDPAVRRHLADQGTPVPDDTWFVAGEHDTTTDKVTLFDTALVPDALGPALRALVADLDRAGAATAAERADRLPGRSAPSQRSTDWAEVRPEWGLAGNLAFVAAPRSATAGVDLGGRAFLHSYDADTDPDGVALETIMTAPLVVAQWISSQYYFSTVDPDVFGAGDKLVHNVVAGLGVLRGGSGDLAVGLPWQSVGSGTHVEHRPLRLLALIQAPLERIEAILARNPAVRDLVEHEWIHLAARSHGHEAWSLRSPQGTWTTWHDVTAPVGVGLGQGRMSGAGSAEVAG